MIKTPVFLIFDAMSQVFRAYYAIRGLSTTGGVPTNATYGLLLMLNRVLEKFPTEPIANLLQSRKVDRPTGKGHGHDQPGFLAVFRPAGDFPQRRTP